VLALDLFRPTTHIAHEEYNQEGGQAYLAQVSQVEKAQVDNVSAPPIGSNRGAKRRSPVFRASHFAFRVSSSGIPRSALRIPRFLFRYSAFRIPRFIPASFAFGL
jgi:hypothetical protein